MRLLLAAGADPYKPDGTGLIAAEEPRLRDRPDILDEFRGD